MEVMAMVKYMDFLQGKGLSPIYAQKSMDTTPIFTLCMAMEVMAMAKYMNFLQEKGLSPTYALKNMDTTPVDFAICMAVKCPGEDKNANRIFLR
jgi:hypothetical protein